MEITMDALLSKIGKLTILNELLTEQNEALLKQVSGRIETSGMAEASNGLEESLPSPIEA